MFYAIFSLKKWENTVLIEPRRNSTGGKTPRYSRSSGPIDRALNWMIRVMSTSDNENAIIQSFVNFLHSRQLLSELDLDLRDPLKSLCRTQEQAKRSGSFGI